LPDSVQIYKTAIDTLYHSPVHEEGAKAKVLEDIARREIKCPTFDDLKAHLRNSFDGTIVDASSPAPLVELIVDMILTQPVNWPDVMASLSNAAPSRSVAHIVHFGPGTGLARPMLRAFGGKAVTTVNATIAEGAGADRNPQEPIAIIGMAVNMPGAPNVAKLWEVLEQGINTVSEVYGLITPFSFVINRRFRFQRGVSMFHCTTTLRIQRPRGR